MDRLLREMYAAVAAAREHGHHQLDPAKLAGYQAAYAEIITLGHRTNPARPGPDEPDRQTRPDPPDPARNLLMRLDRDRDAVLRFTRDFRVPFDNNLAERDIRMIKLQQKISGCWRTINGAEEFLAIRAHLSTAAKHHQSIAETLTALAKHQPWLPAAASP